MFSSLLAVKPLLWATGVLALLLAASSALNVRQFKQLGAYRAECELRISNESANRSQATTDAVADSLRNQVTILEEELKRVRDANKTIGERHAATGQLLSEYRKQLNEARNADPSLDQPADTTRLRALEDAYRVRTQGSGGSSVPSNP